MDGNPVEGSPVGISVEGSVEGLEEGTVEGELEEGTLVGIGVVG